MYDPARGIAKLNTSSKVVEVFKTNVRGKRMAQRINTDLAQLFPNAKINFDLDDCDKILRIESTELCVKEIIELVKGRSFSYEVLD